MKTTTGHNSSLGKAKEASNGSWTVMVKVLNRFVACCWLAPQALCCVIDAHSNFWRGVHSLSLWRHQRNCPKTLNEGLGVLIDGLWARKKYVRKFSAYGFTELWAQMLTSFRGNFPHTFKLSFNFYHTSKLLSINPAKQTAGLIKSFSRGNE